MATVVGLFDTRDRAQAAIEQLRASGTIDPNNISVVMRSREETKQMAEDTGVGGGAVTGAVYTGHRPCGGRRLAGYDPRRSRHRRGYGRADRRVG